MKTVYKYPLQAIEGQKQEISLPRRAKVIHFGLDPAGGLSIWARVDTSLPSVQFTFRLLWTGSIVEDTDSHIGTVIDSRVGLVWHLFAVGT
jgi:hypothetical protein